MRIDFFSGKRGGFGAMLPLIQELMSPRFAADTRMIVTDQHLDPKFGATVSEVKKYGLNIIECPLPDTLSDSSFDRVVALSHLLPQLSTYWSQITPDLVFLYGDRSETLLAASAATIMNIPIAHLQGGDRSGSVDDTMRHAITKLSSLHYVSCEDSAKRVELLGEDRENIILVGDSHVDAIFKTKKLSKAQTQEKIGLKGVRRYCVLLQHPETTQTAASKHQITETLEALASFDIDVIAIYPCSDPGYREIIESIEVGRSRGVIRSSFKNLEFEDFLNLCRYSEFLIGNSSSGIIESAYLDIPVINIGRRQINRVDGGNVIHVPHDRIQISKAIKTLLSVPQRRAIVGKTRRIYGDGNSYKKVAEDLLTRNLSKLLPKHTTY